MMEIMLLTLRRGDVSPPLSLVSFDGKEFHGGLFLSVKSFIVFSIVI